VAGTLSPSSVTPPANGTATATLTLSASASANGSATATVTGTSGAVSKTANVAVSVGSGGGEAFADDFETDKGWQVNAAATDTATSGSWERGDPEQTTSTYSDQIKQRGDTTSGANCLVTGRLAGSEYGANDLDGGVSSMTSPAFTVPAGGKLTFSYTFAHGDNATSADYLRLRVLDGTTPTTVFEKLGSAAEVAGAWQSGTADLASFAGRSVRLVVEAADASTASLWESAVDDVRVTA